MSCASGGLGTHTSRKKPFQWSLYALFPPAAPQPVPPEEWRVQGSLCRSHSGQTGVDGWRGCQSDGWTAAGTELRPALTQLHSFYCSFVWFSIQHEFKPDCDVEFKLYYVLRRCWCPWWTLLRVCVLMWWRGAAFARSSWSPERGGWPSLAASSPPRCWSSPGSTSSTRSGLICYVCVSLA